MRETRYPQPSEPMLLALMTRRCLDRACEGGDDDQRDTSETCPEFYGTERLESWCDLCVFDAAINAIEQRQVANAMPVAPSASYALDVQFAADGSLTLSVEPQPAALSGPLTALVEALREALDRQTERACRFNCDAESTCQCPAHQTRAAALALGVPVRTRQD